MHARSTSGVTALAIRVPTTPHLLAREIKTTSDTERTLVRQAEWIDIICAH